MHVKPLPSQAELHNRFDYRGGKLICRRRGKEAGGPQSQGYWSVKFGGRRYLAHRLIWKWHHGTEPGPCLDHIDGDKRNNEISNLRQIDHAHNIRRAKIGGACQLPNGRWQANARFDGKRHHVGVFDTKAEAQAAIHNYLDAKGVPYD